MENLKTNVKILRDSEKNLKINLDIRYYGGSGFGTDTGAGTGSSEKKQLTQ